MDVSEGLVEEKDSEDVEGKPPIGEFRSLITCRSNLSA